MILAVTIAAAGLVLYGGCLCLWHRATEPVNHELGEAANEPLKKAA